MVVARPVKGIFRTRKNIWNFFLFLVFFALPFLEIGGHPAILLDIPARKFYVFGLSIWPHEMHFLHLILIFLGLMLFFITALFGRLFCAHACPQTLFIELFNLTGRFFAGKKYGKKTAGAFVKARAYFAYFITAIVTGFFFVSYFNGILFQFESLASGNIYADAGKNYIATWIWAWTGASLFALVAFGFLRETACKYICPYGRFQTALLDKHSPIVYYDERRGEPRRQKGERKGVGDCTSCNLCQLVCPTGIDIREGLQVGCIRCGLCVDACTIEMNKSEKKTLIDMDVLGKSEDAQFTRKIIRPRTILYGSLLTVVISLFAVLLFTRIPLYANLNNDAALNNIVIPNEGVRNGYELKVGNMSDNPLSVKIEVIDESNSISLINEQKQFQVAPSDMGKFRLLLQASEKSIGTKEFVKIPFRVRVTDMNNPKYEKVIKASFNYRKI
jgi:cytochrome c oxidase accessory protein FixG